MRITYCYESPSAYACQVWAGLISFPRFLFSTKAVCLQKNGPFSFILPRFSKYQLHQIWQEAANTGISLHPCARFYPFLALILIVSINARAHPVKSAHSPLAALATPASTSVGIAAPLPDGPARPVPDRLRSHSPLGPRHCAVHPARQLQRPLIPARREL